MRTVLLGRRGYFCDLLAAQLERSTAELVGFVEETGQAARRRKIVRELRKRGFAGTPALARDLMALRQYGRDWAAYLNENGHSQPGPCPLPTLRVDDVNDSEVGDHLERLSPDAVLVYGTAIIRAPLLKSIHAPVLNIHGGLVPRYRNVHSEVWAILDGEASDIGSSLLHLDAGVDSGAVADQRRPPILEGDGFFDLRLRNILCGIEMAVEAVTRMGSGEVLARVPQDQGEARMYPTPSASDIQRLRELTDDFSRLP